MSTKELNGRVSSDGQSQVKRRQKQPPGWKSKRSDLLRRRKSLDARRKRAKGKLRTIEAALVLSLGGGSQVTSRVMKLLEDQGTENHVECLAIDTDDTAQAGADNCPSFSDDQFLHLAVDRVINVLENPEAHRKVVDRLGLENPALVAYLSRLLADGVDQAGQVRLFGVLAALAGHSKIKNALQAAISRLKGAHSDLEKQLKSENPIRIRRRMTIHVVCSAAGGTGSSMLLEVLALIRHLTTSLKVDVSVILMMPSVFDSKIKGKQDELERVRANAYATLLELNAFRQGFGQQHDVTVGPTERGAVPVRPGLFNQLMIAGRFMADGRDLMVAEAAFDSLALQLGAELGTEIHDRIELDDANEATMRGMNTDPMTGASRFVSTGAATALVMETETLSVACGARMMDDLIRSRVLGGEPDLAVTGRLSEDWLAQPVTGATVSVQADSLPHELRRTVLPKPDVLTRPLFQSVDASGRVHYKDSEFPARVTSVEKRFQSVFKPELESQLAEESVAVADDFIASLKRRVSEIVRDRGWRTARVFLSSLSGRLSKATEVLRSGQDQDYERAKVAIKRSREDIKPLKTFWGSFGRDRTRQNLVSQHMLDAMTAAIDAAAKEVAMQIVSAVHAEVQRQAAVASQVLRGAKRSLEETRERYQESQSGRSLTTSSLAEIDIVTPETEETLFQRHRLDADTVLQRLSKSFGKKPAAVLRRLVTDKSLFADVMQNMRQYFQDEFEEISVVDVVGDQLANPETEPGCSARIRQAIQGCQPLWKAESRQNDVMFADNMIVGIPEAMVDSKRDVVVKALEDAATRRIHPNSQYAGQASHVISGDRHRIYIVRRTHGAALHYLPEVLECQAAYEQWQLRGGQPVHVFGSDLVAKMPGIVPDGDLDDGLRAWAIGVAYGFIARRGSSWYMNLKQDNVGNKTFVCPTVSHHDGIAFDAEKRITRGGGLDAYVASGRLQFDERTDVDSELKLASGMTAAREATIDNGEVIELILDLWQDYRAATGDLRIIKELDAYTGELAKRNRSSDQNYPLMVEMIEILRREIESLRVS